MSGPGSNDMYSNNFILLSIARGIIIRIYVRLTVALYVNHGNTPGMSQQHGEFRYSLIKQQIYGRQLCYYDGRRVKEWTIYRMPHRFMGIGQWVIARRLGFLEEPSYREREIVLWIIIVMLGPFFVKWISYRCASEMCLKGSGVAFCPEW